MGSPLVPNLQTAAAGVLLQIWDHRRSAEPGPLVPPRGSVELQRLSDLRDQRVHLRRVHGVWDGRPCFKHEFVWSWKVLNIAPFVILNKSGLLTGNTFKILCRAFEFGRPRVFVRTHVHHEVQLFQLLWLFQLRKGELFAAHGSFHLSQTCSKAFQHLSSGQPPDSVMQQEIRLHALHLIQ
ncbi:hypothetical protein GOODEAATRI_029791 [Goodea atripinnis]|uniref:Uncharacterized protein n=1 Tax=Goodea atripinnis TaxID=208336 RepID=A0ABV0NI43_9TELE